ncbi:MAG: phage protein Gp27 family protein [Roseibium sp.]|uniref:phage protein Gp27 family protein n=1 Tax=Roseibium sp. TaxID=1936156 RepID=UPI003267B30E
MTVPDPKTRKGRGRLSSIDLLPPEADGAIQWAVEQLAERQRTQGDILFEFNDRLEAIGCERISSSSFNRYSTRRAATLRKLAETREIAAAVAETLGPERGDDVTVMIVQLLKETIHAAIEGGGIGTKGVMELARALQSAVSAQRLSADGRRAPQTETRARLEKATQVAADGIAASSPEIDGEAVLKKIREEVYGIFESQTQDQTKADPE